MGFLPCLPLFPPCCHCWLQVAESCRALRALDVTVARRVTGLLMGEEAEQLGFRALFTLAANCPLLEVRTPMLLAGRCRGCESSWLSSSVGVGEKEEG